MKRSVSHAAQSLLLLCCLFMLMQLKDYQTRNMGANLWSVAVASVASCACYMLARILRIRYVVVSVFYCCNCPVCCPFERQKAQDALCRP